MFNQNFFIMEYLRWRKDSEEMRIVELSEEIFDQDCGVAQCNSRNYTVPRPTYAGFFKGQLLIIEIDRNDDDVVIFSGKYSWECDDDLKKFLTIFFVGKGLYPSFRDHDNKVFMRLSKI